MNYHITIDGVRVTEDECIAKAVEATPWNLSTTSAREAAGILQLMGHEVEVGLPHPHVVGIDNGLTGSVVVISHASGSIIAKTTMPSRKRNGKNEIDIVTLRNWLMGVLNGRMCSATYFIEEPVGSKSLNAAKSMAASFHAIRGMLDCKGLDWRGVPARTWQKAIFGKSKEDTKVLSVAKAKELWPDEEWLRTPRCKSEDNGLTDGALIAHYGRTLP